MIIHLCQVYVDSDMTSGSCPIFLADESEAQLDVDTNYATRNVQALRFF